MLRLIRCEFWKLKRKKFVLFIIGAAFLFPVPMVVFAKGSGLDFNWLFLNTGVFSYFLLQPTVLGILGAILFCTERANGTQKNIRAVPVSPVALTMAKVIVLLIFSLLYSLAENGAVLIGGFIIGNVEGVPGRLCVSLLIGLMVPLAILPVLAIECLGCRGYIFSIILSFAYASASFAVVFAMSNVLSPLSAVFRWALPHMTDGPTYGLDDWFLSTPACIGVLALTAVSFIVLTVIFKPRQEI